MMDSTSLHTDTALAPDTAPDKAPNSAPGSTTSFGRGDRPPVASVATTVGTTLGAIDLATLWRQLIAEAACCGDPIMSRLLGTSIHRHADFPSGLAWLIARPSVTAPIASVCCPPCCECSR